MNWLYQKWWKWLCVALLVYVSIGGLIVPLGPGITEVTPITFPNQSSCTSFTIKGYHTHFDQKDMQVWLKNGAKYFCADTFYLQPDNSILARFGFNPSTTFDKRSFDVVINNAKDGTVALRDAVTLLTDTTTPTTGTLIGSAECTPEVNVNKTAGLIFPYREILYESIRNTFFPRAHVVRDDHVGFHLAHRQHSLPGKRRHEMGHCFSPSYSCGFGVWHLRIAHRHVVGELHLGQTVGERPEAQRSSRGRDDLLSPTWYCAVLSPMKSNAPALQPFIMCSDWSYSCCSSTSFRG
jgi:hypothetical protein